MASSVGSVQYRLAQHYLTRLQQANTAFRRGHGNRTYWYNQIEQDWSQIRQWQAWSVNSPDDDLEKAQLCVGFSVAGLDILRVRQTPSERITWLQQALDAAIRVGNGEAQRTILHLLAQAHFFASRAEQATQLANQLMILSQQAKDTFNIACAYYTHGSVAQQLGKFDEAEEYLRKALTGFEKCRATAEIGRIYQGFGRIAQFRGDYQLAHDYFRKYLEIVEGSGREGELSVALLSMSNGLVSLRDFATAERYAERSVQICRHIGFTRMLPAALLSLAMCESEIEKLDQAANHYQEGIEIANSINMKNLVVSGHVDLGNIHRRRGNYSEAAKSYEEALVIALDKKAPYYICLILGNMAYLHLLQEQPEATRKALQKAIKIATELGTEPFLAKTLLMVVVFMQYVQAYETATRWLGLLQRYTSYLDLRLFDPLCAELETSLGAEMYEQLILEGQSLELVEVIHEAQVYLDSR